MEEAENNEGADRPPELQPRHGNRCREAAVLAMRAFLDLLETAVSGDTVPVDTVRRIAHAVMGAEGALATYYDLHADGCAAFFELVKTERKRTDFFGRAITDLLVPLLDDPNSGFERKNLPQFFSALRMMLGDDIYTDYKDRCTEVANQLRAGGEFVPMDAFHADARIRDIVEATQVAVARSFKRFDARKEWFLIVMNTDPHSVSLGSNMFVPKNSDQKLAHAFGEAAFVRLFRTLFAPMRMERFDDLRRAEFAQKYGTPPEAVFGSLFVELAALDQSAAAAPVRRRGPAIETRQPSAKRRR